MTEKIREYADDLGKMPFSAPVELLLEGRAEGFRSKVVKGLHKIVYFVGNGTVYIVTVLDCRRDPALLKDTV
jgi:plasmid stabilization system protein ParE